MSTTEVVEETVPILVEPSDRFFPPVTGADRFFPPVVAAHRFLPPVVPGAETVYVLSTRLLIDYPARFYTSYGTGY